MTAPPIKVVSSAQSDELNLQKKLRTEVIQLEDTLAQVRKEYEMLRIEFEQNLAANEQAGERRFLPPYPCGTALGSPCPHTPAWYSLGCLISPPVHNPMWYSLPFLLACMHTYVWSQLLPNQPYGTP